MANVIPADIDKETVRTMVRAGAQLVEVLSKEQYEKVHLAGAINIPLDTIDRLAVEELQWDEPVIVYCHDYQWDLSARAAWRLISLGFSRVFRYKAGKKDWMASGLPIEGKEAHIQRAGDLARLDVPTCSLAERIGEVKERVQKAGWDSCVVVFDDDVVLGLLRPGALEVDPQDTAEQAMESGPRSYRLDAPLEKAMQYMEKMAVDSVLVTNGDGKLFGLLKREDVENALQR